MLRTANGLQAEQVGGRDTVTRTGYKIKLPGPCQGLKWTVDGQQDIKRSFSKMHGKHARLVDLPTTQISPSSTPPHHQRILFFALPLYL